MKLAVIGTGKIVRQALFAMEELVNTGVITLTSIFARPHSRDKAEELAACYHIPEVYTDYEKLLSSDSSDAVYIGLVNSVHLQSKPLRLPSSSEGALPGRITSMVLPTDANEILSSLQKKASPTLLDKMPFYNEQSRCKTDESKDFVSFRSGESIARPTDTASATAFTISAYPSSGSMPTQFNICRSQKSYALRICHLTRIQAIPTPSLCHQTPFSHPTS